MRWRTAIDILVCTTIIETGIDIPEREHAYHRERGQHGSGAAAPDSRPCRSFVAPCVMALPKLSAWQGALSEIAERLGAIREFAAFGSGFKIAMRDLEIRGAGTCLAPSSPPHDERRLRSVPQAARRGCAGGEGRNTQAAYRLVVFFFFFFFFFLAFCVFSCGCGSARSVPPYRASSARTSSAVICSMSRSTASVRPPAEAIALLDIALLRAKASELGDCGGDCASQPDGRLLPHLFSRPISRACPRSAATVNSKGRLLLNAGSTPYLSLRLNKGRDSDENGARRLVDKYAATAK